MSKNEKRKEQGSYRVKKWGERLDDLWDLLRNEQTIIIAMYIFCIFLLAGGIFNAVENAPAVISSSTGTVAFVWPGLSGQTLYESLGSATFFGITLIGVYLMYQSTRRLHEPRYSSQLLLFGSLIFIFGFLAFELLLSAKGVGI